MNSELYLCICAREFPAQALLRLRPELRAKAVVVMDGDAPFQRVCSLNKFARALGVVAGMSRTEIDTFPSVTAMKRSLEEERAARKAMLEWAGSFSPRVEDDSGEERFLCVLDIAGTEKLFGAPPMLAMRLKREIVSMGIICSVAVSANYSTAVCLARGAISCRNSTIVQPGQERQALASLPLSVLDITADHAETFSQWGVSTLGVLAMLPEKDLIARLGQEGSRLRQLARGESAHLLVPAEPMLALEERLELDSPVEVLDSLLFGVGLMLEQLIARAGARVLSLAEVTAELGLEGGGLHSRMVRPALPSNDKHLWLKLLHLDWIAHPPQAAVLSMRLKGETGAVGKVQLGLFSPQLPEPGRLDVTLARIRAVVGEERVGSAELQDTHKPGSFRMKDFSVIAPITEKQQESRLPAAVMRCLRPAERVAVTLRNSCPQLFYFRGVAYQIENAYGPWHAVGGWWTNGQWSVEEWDIVARARDKTFGGNLSGGNLSKDRAANLLCCCMTRDVASDRWHIEALYD